MALLANLALFFVFYLPLTYWIGLPGDFYVGPTQVPENSYPFFIWLVVVGPLLLPSLAWVPVAHVLVRVGLRRFERNRVRGLAAVLLPAGLLGVHLWVWGDVVLSVPLLVVMIIPGALYGLVFRMPRLAARSSGEG